MSAVEAVPIDPKSGNTFEAVFDSQSKVTIGDQNSADFKPHILFEKWETSMSLMTPTSAKISPVLDKNVIGWDDQANNIGVRFYPLKNDGHLLELGGMEYEVILYAAPPSPEIPFAIETSGLDFFYQPEELSKSEIEQGATERPENVKGSLAVYHQTQKGGSKYKTGKAFHLLRPTAKDFKGRQIYGKWNLSLDANLITALFDPAWLLSAVYPVVIGPTLGYTSVGGSTFSAFSSYLVGNHYQMPAAGTATAFNVYTERGDVNFTMGIYNSDGSTPSTLISATAGGVCGGGNSPSWKSKSIAGSLSNAAWYCLGIQYDSSPTTSLYYDIVSTPRSLNIRSYTDGSMPDPFPSPSNDTLLAISAYIDYSTGGGSSPTYPQLERGVRGLERGLAAA